MGPSDTYADRIGRLLYARTDEKDVVRAALARLFAGRRFRDALDVGPGPGLVTAPLAATAERLTLVEADPTYEAPLRRAFPHARVVIGSIRDFSTGAGEYDAILASQMLYYQPESEWLPLCRRLFEALRPGGVLALVMNRDSGDWWNIVEPFLVPLRPHLRFHYVPLGGFIRDLATLAPVTDEAHRYEVRFESTEQIAEFIGRQALQIYDETVLAAHAEAFRRIAAALSEKHGAPRIVADGALLSLVRR